MKFWAGDYDSSEKIILKGLAVLPENKSQSHQAKIDKQRYSFYELLGKINVQKKNLPKALEYFLLSQAVSPQEKNAYQNISDTCWKLNKTKEAFFWLEQGKKIDSNDSAWDYNQALYYLKLGKKTEALTSANKALKINPEDKQIKQLIKEITASVKTRIKP